MSFLETVLEAEINEAGLPAPVREYRFHDTRNWRFDFCWPDHMLAVEVEGGVWANGRHNRGSGFIADCEKYNAAAILGWRVLRIPSDWISKTAGGIETIKRAFEVIE